MEMGNHSEENRIERSDGGGADIKIKQSDFWQFVTDWSAEQSADQ